MLCLLAAWQNLAFYLQPEINLILGLMLTPFVFRIRSKGVLSWRYAVAAGVSLALFGWLHMQIFFLLGVGMTILFILESRVGKMGPLPFLLICLLSPVLQYLVTVFTFPLRLEWSRLAAKGLSLAGQAVSVQGNVFTLNGHEFSVDPACLGLNTIITGLIFTTLMLAFAEKKHNRPLPFWMVMGLYSLAGMLLLVSNLFRIICLVLFHSMPESLSHELIGLFCLVVYVLGPIYWVISMWGKKNKQGGIQDKWEKGEKQGHVSPQTPKGIFLAAAVLLILVIGWFNWHRDAFRNEPKDAAFASLEVPGMTKVLQENGIARFESDSLLMYLKPPARFWGADHTPAICWRGSGYNFTYIRQEEVNGHCIYLAKLQKEDHSLHTAWWYDNGSHRTCSQLDWRFRTAKGQSPFRLVNLASQDLAGLLKAVGEVEF